jgi:nucleoside-diphosphate-sugar epimerase
MLDDSSESVYNVGSAEPVSILEFARIVAEVTDSLLIEEPYPNLVQSPNFSLVPDVTKLGSLGWTQEFTLWDSILETYEWTQAK